MKLVADLHIHSRYSRAVSEKMTLSEIAKWAKLKGIDLVGTGDFTHPLWFREITSELEEAGEGLYKLKVQSSKLKITAQKPKLNDPLLIAHNSSPLFILQTEISSIYSQGGSGRRIHNLVYAPSIKAAEKINKELDKKGVKLISDGRPVVGLSSIELCELVFGIDQRCLIVPAHIWTPWYSLFGSKSGFDSISECFGKYAKYIYGIETGLSSDPAMNWRIKELNGRAILSSSDAHSGAKLGREVTVFEIPDGRKTSENSENQNVSRSVGQYTSGTVSQYNTEQGDTDLPKYSFTDILTHRNTDKLKFSEFSNLLTYADIYEAIKSANYKDKTKPRVAGTIEFYPEEGKYHYTGHRKCKVRYSPEETEIKGTTCPVCGKPLTVGVMHRVNELSGREIFDEDLPQKKDDYGVVWIFHPKNQKPPYTMLVPLLEVLAEVHNCGVNTQKVQNEYNNLIKQVGHEFYILLRAPLEKLAQVGGERLVRAIEKNRAGDIQVNPGFDGEFGEVHIFGEEEKKDDQQEQLGIF